MKSSRPSEAMYQVLGTLTGPSASAYSGALAHDLRRQEEPGALAAQLAVAVGGADDVVHQVVEVADLDVVLGDVDELEVVGEEPAHERHAQADLHRARQLVVGDGQLVIALERLGDLRERGAVVLDGLDQEARLVVLDPLLDARHDLRLAQVLGRDPEGLLREAEQFVQAPAPHRPVLVQRPVVGRAAGRRRSGAATAAPPRRRSSRGG